MTESLATAGDVILDIRDVQFAYGGVKAVDGASFSIDRGTVTGLIGPNGAGKSTLIEVLSGTLSPDRGAILFQGVDTRGWGPPRVSQMGIARTFQTARVLPRLTVLENVLVAAQGQQGENPLKAMFWRRSWAQQEDANREEAKSLLNWLGLSDHLEKPAGTLSGGQRRLMEISRALLAHPKLLLLDEPTAGVFPETSRLIATRIREIVAQGVTILLIAHNMEFLSTVADDVVVMAEGKVLTRGPLDSVRQHEDVIAAYLGVGGRSLTPHPTTGA
ncbi:MAG: ABC transporter ATP-binding protein [Candidatus Dormibacteria bacterium]